MTDRMPTSAFIAVTLRCNSRCVMCDIWKHREEKTVALDVYTKLPKTLTMIDITGGEPFLRADLPKIAGVIRNTCPRARILITTNGLLPGRIRTLLPEILAADPGIAIRVSLDGLGAVHGAIRGIPNAFHAVEETFRIIHQAGVKDAGAIFTLMDQNRRELLPVFEYCRARRLNFSLNIAHDSPVYFGEKKVSFRPRVEDVERDISSVARKQFLSLNPKNWAKAWFNGKIPEYMKTHRRPLPCGAGENFFYMDPQANIFLCHLKNFPVGNLKNASFSDIWSSAARQRLLPKTRTCQDCWMMCTAKDEIKRRCLGPLV